jgi:hypothetical protein
MVVHHCSNAVVYAAARQLCAERAATIRQHSTHTNGAAIAAKTIVAEACESATDLPVGVAICAPGHPLREALVPICAAGAEPLSAAEAALKQPGPASALGDCPYCQEPHKRFCPESGRRHESPDDKVRRMWQALFRQVQFSSRMASLARLDKPNTCAEEFYVEI